MFLICCASVQSAAAVVVVNVVLVLPVLWAGRFQDTGTIRNADQATHYMTEWL